MSYIMFYDTETTGLVNQRLPAADPEQPYLVQLGLLLTTELGKEVMCVDMIVKPDGWKIPDGAARVHGITTDIASKVGLPLATVLSAFSNMRAVADEMVAFNSPFDDLVLEAAIHRHGRKPSHPGPGRRRDVMVEMTPICALPATERMKAAGYGDKHKSPNLTEAHMHFFGTGFEGAHGALVDARATARIYFEMKRRAGEQDGVSDS